MENTILGNIGLDPVYLIILLFLIQVLLFVMLISVNMKYNRLKTSYSSFMKGKDGKKMCIRDRYGNLPEGKMYLRRYKYVYGSKRAAGRKSSD